MSGFYFTNGGGYSTATGTNNVLHILGYVLDPPPVPTCSRCGAETRDGLINDRDRKPCCKRCALIQAAPRWIEAAFIAVGRDRQKMLYRQLATVFHPDAGGDERLMKALNAVKEKFS